MLEGGLVNRKESSNAVNSHTSPKSKNFSATDNFIKRKNTSASVVN